MADIAILVAEEYERRMKNPRQEQKGAAELQDLVSGVSISATATATASRVKKMMELELELELAQQNEFKWVFEPKSQIGRAASTGFFSA
ncbi:uncharacterized protein LOC111781261 [Cucurbita pepo subsp. pepo]|uniref:uncharacterized protein LOC111781261 n=1 Tax=Cucurbita pepo subsp. pepo TaxID=3664 RepID=UPI000C9D4FEB|nr:uncharacterized protein LOC111781261 [Cucurbita pepo subsp. pepo]